MKTFTQSIKIIAIALFIGWGVSAVYAWTAPTVNPPGTGTVKSPVNDTAKGVAASINLTNFDQIKRGGLLISGADNSFVSPLSFFKKTLLPGSDTSVYIGGASYADPSFASSFPGTRSVPMTINLTGRADTTGAIKFKTDAQCPVSTKLINTNASAFEFWNTAENTNADILAKGIRLDGGNPAAGKILISVDGDGRAVWATPKLAANGTDIIFDTYSDSPVGICGTPVTPTTYNWVTLWSGCKYFDDAAVGNGYMEDPSSNICKDSNGNTVSNSLCTQPVPGPRQAASSLPLCSAPASCQAYQVKANCNGGSAVYVPNGCTKITLATTGTCASGNPQEIYNIECSSPQTEQSISNGAAAAGFGATHLNNQNPQQCTGANAPMTAWYCHTAGVDQWVTAESRGQDITCTGPYLPIGTFTEGDIVCAQNKPGLSLCKENGSINSTCRPGDSVCPN